MKKTLVLFYLSAIAFLSFSIFASASVSGSVYRYSNLEAARILSYVLSPALTIGALVTYRFFIRKSPMRVWSAIIVSLITSVISTSITAAIISEISYGFSSVESIWGVGIWIMVPILSAGSKGKEKAKSKAQMLYENRCAFINVLHSTNKNTSTEEDRQMLESFEYLTNHIYEAQKKKNSKDKKRAESMEQRLRELVANPQFQKIISRSDYSKLYMTSVEDAIFNGALMISRSTIDKSNGDAINRFIQG